MMNRTERELNADFKRSHMSLIKGDRTRYLITYKNTALPGEEIYVDIPKMKESSCLVPGSLHLVFDFNVTGTKSHFMNNLSKQLQKRLQIQLAGETVYDCAGESVYETYKDLWRTENDRVDLVEYGVTNKNLRKLISNDDSGANSGDAAKLMDALMYSIYSNKQRINVSYILKNHGLYAPFSMNNNFRYIITLPAAKDVLLAQSGETLGTYTLDNIQLEYETIDNPELANSIANNYFTGRSLSYEHLTLLKSTVWDASSTLVNETINVPRRSMKAIVLLFTKPVRTDTEEFLYPNIENVKVTIEGVSNVLYTQGIPKSRFYEEAKRLFHQDSEKVMTIEKFYKNKFALVIDLRAHQEITRTGHGKRVVNTQSGVLLEISKKAHTGNLNCSIYVLSDGLINFSNRDLLSIQY